jgi:hypothetical protein
LIVISAGMQKAASASYFNLANSLLVAAGFEDIHALRQRFHLSFFMSEVNCNIGPLRAYKLAWLGLPHMMGQTFVVKTHEPPSPTARILIKLGQIRPTYIYRDPRDVAVSLFEHGERLRRGSRRSNTQFDQLATLEQAIAFTGRLLPIWRAWIKLDRCLLVRFEQFTDDMRGEAQRLSQFLGLELEPEEINQIVGSLDPRANAQDKMTGPLHMNVGQGGRWKARMTEGQKELSQRLFGPYLELMGY